MPGTGLSSPPVTLLNTMDAITQKYIYPVLGDTVFTPSPTLWSLIKRKPVDLRGGGAIVYPIINQEEIQGGAYTGAQILDSAVVDSISPAEQQWRSYQQPIVLPVLDMLMNRGGQDAVDILTAKFEVVTGSMLQKLSRAAWGVSPQNTSIDVDNIPAWLNNTSNTIAGINRATAGNAFWKPATAVSNGSGALTAANAEKAYQSVALAYDQPDLLLLNNTDYGNFKSQFTGQVRFDQNLQDQEAVQAGFRYHFLFNNCVVLPDPVEPQGTGFMVNTKYLRGCFLESDYFTTEPWTKPSNQRILVSYLYLTWNIINPSPRMGVAVTNLS